MTNNKNNQYHTAKDSNRSLANHKYNPKFLDYGYKSLAEVLFLYFIAEYMVAGPTLLILFAVLLLTAAILIPSLYTSKIKQIRNLNAFQYKGIIYRFLSGEVFKLIFWSIYAFVISFFMVVQLHTYTFIEWLFFISVIPIFYLVYKLINLMVRKEIRSYLVTNISIIWACRICPILMFILIFIIFSFLNINITEIPRYDSFESAILDEKNVISDLNESALVYEVAQVIAFYNGAKNYVLSNVFSVNQFIAFLIYFVGCFVIFYNACVMFSGFLIPKKEYLRLFGPISEDEHPSPVSKEKIAYISGISFFIIIFLVFPLVAMLDSSIQQNSNITATRKNIEKSIIATIERIDNSFYKSGTIQKLEKARMKALHKAQMSSVRVETLVERSFDEIEDNVDIYLDWYYSVLGEYTRIIKLLSGNIKMYMRSKLKECLQQGEQFKELNSSLDKALQKHKEILKEYKKTKQAILDQNKIEKPEKDFKVVRKISLTDIQSPLDHEDVINFDYRVGSSSVAGGMSAVVTGIIIKKILAKSSVKVALKTAAKAISKILFKYTALGTTIGGVIGSVVPGAGTALGAFAGGALGGIVVGISVDTLLLKLEETYSREDFKRQLIQAIEETRKEVKQDLLKKEHSSAPAKAAAGG